MTSRADVLVLTVNKYETEAVLKAFKAATGQDAVPIPVHDRVYRDLGVVNGTRVFHALSEMGSGGVGGTQQAVDKGIRALRPTAVIAVGIAFGVNETKQEIGDILLSLLQKSRFARDFLQREAKVEGAGGHFWHDEALTQTPQRPRNGCYPTPSDPATLECGPA